VTAYRLTHVARRDVETIVRKLSRDDLRAAERTLDEMCATMEWLSGTPDVGQVRDDLVPEERPAGAPRLRTWTLRDWLLVYRDPAPEEPPGDPAGPAAAPEPLTVLRVLEAARPR
jgi:plasmid stabilization system protein ParE